MAGPAPVDLWVSSRAALRGLDRFEGALDFEGVLDGADFLSELPNSLPKMLIEASMFQAFNGGIAIGFLAFAREASGKPDIDARAVELDRSGRTIPDAKIDQDPVRSIASL